MTIGAKRGMLGRRAWIHGVQAAVSYRAMSAMAAQALAVVAARHVCRNVSVTGKEPIPLREGGIYCGYI